MTLNHFSLFTGIGGIDIAASWAGFTTVGMCEIDDYCRKVLDKHWPDVPKWRDIFELTGEEILDKCGRIDLLSGGLPCQPFSAAGKRKGQADERYLWPEMFRIIREVKPQWVLGENVRGILSIDAGRTFGRILADLAESGYRVGWLCYGAGDVGAPHKRERVFIVAYSRGGGFGKQGICREQQRGAEAISTSEGSCWLVADTEKPKGAMDRPIAGEQEQGQFGGRGGEGVLADTKKSGLSQSRGRGRGTEKQPRSECYCIYAREQATERTAQPGLGGVLNEFPCGMDRTKWPAGKWPAPTASDPEGGVIKNVQFDGNSWFRENRHGARWGIKLKDAVEGWPAGPGEQHPWEPPRIATGVKDRVERLKALGNAVVPAQVYPILKAISEIERGIQK